MLRRKIYSNNIILIQKCLKVKSMPHFTLLSDTINDALNQIKTTFNTIISEFYINSYFKNTSLELIWKNEPVKNQSHLSDVNFYLLIRIYGENEHELNNRIDSIVYSIINNLNNKKIITIEDDFDLSLYLQANYQYQEARMIRKSESIERLGNYFIPQYYSMQFVSSSDELDGIINYMINIRNAIVSIPIIPITLTDIENNMIDYMLNSYSTLVNGFSSPVNGYIRDAMAEKPLTVLQQIKNNINYGCFFTVPIVMSDRVCIDMLASKFVIEYAGNNPTDSVSFTSIPINEIIDVYRNNSIIYPWKISDIVLNKNRIPVFNYSNFQPFYRFPFIYTSTELKEIFRLPIGSKKITAGFNIIEIEKRNKSYTSGIINTADIILGSLENISQSQNVNIGFNLKDLTRHMLVVGTPGQGKSTFLVGLMDRLWKLHNIPFLVIEPAKNEYRALIDSIPDLQVFSPGKSKIAPYIINPFIPPKGVPLEIYKSIVKSAFSIAFEMWTPLDQLFDETLNICYSQKGWLDNSLLEDGKESFSLPDFINVYKKVVASKGYTGEYKKQIETAGVMRLNGLLEQNVNIFDNINTVPIDDILSKPTVIELSGIRDIKQKSFIIALLLNNIYAYVEANLPNDGQLKNAILLEEAHVLLGGDNPSINSEGESANVAAVKLLSNMLAEIRSRGVGIIIADQSPKKVSSEVIANTNLKISFRLVEETDRQIIKRSSLMNDLQFDRLAKLRVGQALIYFDKLDEAEEIMLDDYRLKNSIVTDLSDIELSKKLIYWNDKRNLLIPYKECTCLECCSEGCDFDIRQNARMIANNVFQQTYGINYRDGKELSAFYNKFNSYINREINRLIPHMKDNQRCIKCAKIYLNRKIHFTTDIIINENSRIKYAKSLNNLNKEKANEEEHE